MHVSQSTSCLPRISPGYYSFPIDEKNEEKAYVKFWGQTRCTIRDVQMMIGTCAGVCVILMNYELICSQRSNQLNQSRLKTLKAMDDHIKVP